MKDMPQTKNQAKNILIRDIRPDERDAVLGLRQDTLYSEDYLPAVLDTWLADPDVRIRVAIDEAGEVVGVHAFRKLEDGQCWLSGLRVRVDARRQGVATLILEDAIELARSEGIRTLRYATATDNEAVHQLSRTQRLRSRGAWLSFERRVEPSDCQQDGPGAIRPEGINVLGAADAPRILSLLKTGARTLYVESYAWRSLDERSFARLASEGRAFGCAGETGGWGIALLGRTGDDELEATLHGTDMLCAQSLIGFLRRTACETNPRQLLTLHVPQENPAASILGSLVRQGELRHVAGRPHRVWELAL